MILFSQMKIYTKTGDKGTPSLFNGLKVKKSNKIIEALGSLDELNAVLGTIELPQIVEIQKDLMLINASIAGFKTVIPKAEKLEKEIDKMERTLPKLKNFILPQGQLHVARAVCRRAERKVVDSGRGQNDILKYLNRLSDYLFVLARYENHKKRVREIVWKQTAG